MSWGCLGKLIVELLHGEDEGDDALVVPEGEASLQRISNVEPQDAGTALAMLAKKATPKI